MVSMALVVEQHAQEAAFLWSLRCMATLQLHYAFVELTKLDSRVEAHIDGLRIAGDAGWEICREALDNGEVGEVFVATFLAFESGQKDRIDTVLKTKAELNDLVNGLAGALEWLPFEQAEPHIAQLLASSSAILRRVGIAASAAHRRNPGAPLVNVLTHTNPLLRARALEAVGELGLKNLLPEVKKALVDQDELCRFSAAWSAALIAGDSNAIAILKSVAESDLPYREKALQVAVRRMDLPAANTWQRKLAENTEQARIAILAAGAIGDPASVPWIIELMNVQEVSRPAGEAFSMITGVDIAYQDLESEAPEGFEAGPTENPEDDDVAMDPDENLPWPDPVLIAKWWDKQQSGFKPGTRYLLGKPITIESLQQVLREGKQRPRAAAALELAIRQPGTPLFNVAAPGFRQQQLLGIRP